LIIGVCSCKKNPGDILAAQPANITVGNPLWASYVVLGSDLIGYNIKIDVYTYNSNDEVVHYGTSPYNINIPTEPAYNRGQHLVDQVLQKPEGATKMRADAHITSSGCSHPVPHRSFGNEFGGTSILKATGTESNFPTTYSFPKDKFKLTDAKECL
jgi:hypothetical protein